MKTGAVFEKHLQTMDVNFYVNYQMALASSWMGWP